MDIGQRGANSGGGISASRGPATQPVLSVGGGTLELAWVDNPLPAAPANSQTVYVKAWNGSSFAEALPGDAQYSGITNRLGAVQSVAMSVDASGHPYVTWAENDSGLSQVDVLGSTATVGTIHYVNGSSTIGDSFTTAVGSDANSGLSPSSPKATLQGVLSDAAHPLQPGDVIFVDNGAYTGNIDLSSLPAGVLIYGSPTGNSVISGAVTATGGGNFTLAGLSFTGGVTLTNTSNVQLLGDNITSQGAALSGGSNIELAHDTFNLSGSAIAITGSTSNIAIEDNTITSGAVGVSVAGSATGLDIRGNVFTGAGSGITLTTASAGAVAGNDISVGQTGITIAAAFTGPITSNTIRNAVTGVNYQASAVLSGNSIHDNATGIMSTVSSTSAALGFVGTAQPNQIFANAVGVQLNNATMQNQHVYSNTLGVMGSGVLGGIDLTYANVLESNTVTVNFTGTIQYNRIDHEAVGIEAQSGLLIAYNVIFDNSQAGIDVHGKTAVSIINNTLYAPAGDNVDINGGSTATELLNNILWAQSDYDINVANDSQTGYFSDYNNLYSSATGKLVHWDIDFTDILDWQDDVAQYDLHSEGTTVVNPTLTRPQLISIPTDNFQVAGLFATIRKSSPTINAGDPITDQDLPAAYQNLLGNSGFENGLTGWTASPSGAAQSSGTPPWQGSNYFFAGPNAVVTLDQTVSLTASGITTSQIDAGNQIFVYGGRTRSASETTPDAGSIVITFYDAGNNVLSTTTANSDNPSTHWELIGGRVAVPAGARTARFRFTAVRNTGSTNDAYLDGAFAYIQSDSVALDQGAYGDVRVENQATTGPLLRLISPDLYTDWLRNLPLAIRWMSLGNTTNAPVKIDLYQDTPNGPQFLLNITPATPDTGEFDWIAANSGINFGSAWPAHPNFPRRQPAGL